MFTKRIYLIRNDTEIFCNDRQIVAECLGDRTKEIPARHLCPVSVDGSRFAVRDRPACVKATEMVDTQDVQILKLCADTRDPPGEIAVLMCIPCIERIAPELPGCRKITPAELPQQRADTLSRPGRIVLYLPRHLHCPWIRRSGYRR